MDFDNLEKLNRLRMINEILYTIYDIVNSAKNEVEVKLEESDFEYHIEDSTMEQIIKRVKYDIETLERYLWWNILIEYYV